MILAEVVLLELTTGVDEIELTLVSTASVTVVGYAENGTAYPPVTGGTAASPVLTVRSPVPKGLKQVSIRAGWFSTIHLYAVRIPGEPGMTRHIADELARWSQQGEVLEPHTDYRLAVTTRVEAKGVGALGDYAYEETATEFAYFRTGGPPGCAPTPEDAPGLQDLTRYVRQTMPRTIFAPGEGTAPPPLLYRNYDVGIEFSENYTELMYRRARRDLQLYLYDNNGPARDETGRILVLDNQWGQTETLTLTEGEERWLRRVAGSKCIPTVPVEVRRNSRLLAPSKQQLAPSTQYEARLVPLLLHEDFGLVPPGTAASGPGARLGRWSVHDLAAPPSRWMVREGGDPPAPYVVQDTSTATLLVCGDQHGDSPAQWTSYRVSVWVRAPHAGAAGIAFRVQDAGRHYLVSYSAEPGSNSVRRQLLRVVGAKRVVLAENAAPSTSGADVQLTVEAIGSWLRVYERSTLEAPPALVFDVQDATYERGASALYCASNSGARFSDVRVDDFSDTAPVVYRFRFVTARHADFTHQLHSFQDETETAPLPSDAHGLHAREEHFSIDALLASAVNPATAPSEAESRAHDAITKVLGDAGGLLTTEMHAFRVERDGKIIALRLRSPEPLEWERIALEVRTAARVLPPASSPRALKLTDVAFGTDHPNEESITFIARESLNLAGCSIDYRAFPKPGSSDPAPAWNRYYTFDEVLPVSASTRVRVHGGNAGQSPPPDPRVVTRFASPSGSPSALRLPADGVELRIVTSDGRLEHARAFLHPDHFAPLAGMRVLRSADQTSVFLLTPGAPLAHGTLSLRFSFRRDNRAVNPSSPVLSAGGDIGAEHVTLHVPV
jgi:hypothetical protein